MITLKQKHVYIGTLSLGIVALLLAALRLDGPPIDLLRTTAGIGFILTVGTPYVDLIFRKAKLNIGLKTLFVFAISLLMIYPAGIINIVLEGKEDIYREHLTGLLAILMLFFLVGVAINKIAKVKAEDTKIGGKSFWGMIGIVGLGLLLRSLALGEANLNGDEIDLAVASYDLVDGMVAGRNAYFISQTGHSPLGFYISHAFYNLFTPAGFYAMADATVRLPQVLMGVLTIFGTYIMSREFIKKEHLTLIPPALIAVDNYSNFASRLAIFQDLSTFAFFVVVLVVSIKLFADKKNWSAAIMLGVSFGSLLLVKFSGVLFAPILFALFFVYRREFKKLISAAAISMTVFLPVIFYNIAAYIKTGYMDVPFAKLANMIGIDAKSIMTVTAENAIYSGGIRNPINTLIEMPFALMDQWGLGMGIVFLWAFIYGLKNIKQKENIILYSVVLISVVFFALNGFRTYYFPYFSVVFAVLVAMNLKSINKKLCTALALVIAIPFSLFYSINTNVILKETGSIKEYGRSGEAGLLIDYHCQLTDPYSYGAIGFLSDQGWDELTAYLKEINPTYLILDKSLNPLSMKWYLGINDEIRMFHGDENYEEKYEYTYLTDWDGKEMEGMAIIAISEGPYEILKEEIIRDKNGNIEFYVYWTL